MAQEQELLRSAPPMMSHSPRPDDDDRRSKQRDEEKSMWKLDAPRVGLGADSKGPLLDPKGKVRFRTI